MQHFDFPRILISIFFFSRDSWGLALCEIYGAALYGAVRTPPRPVSADRGTERAHAPGQRAGAARSPNEKRPYNKKSTLVKVSNTTNRDYSSFSYVKVYRSMLSVRWLTYMSTCAPRKLPTTLPSRATRGLQALSKQASQSHAVYGALSAERFRARQGHPPRGGGRGTSSRTLVGHSGAQWGTVGVPLRPPRSGARPACAP